jgi:very-short-patch-repair endonuclease
MKEVMEQEEAELNEYVRLKKREMFKKALAVLEKQSADMYEYKEAIDVVDDYLSEHPDKFDSSYEVLAAIVLVHNRIYSKMQYKVGRYQVDFLLPELFVVLEIDGERHVHKKAYDTKRDIQLQQMLGDGWDIIRIKTDYLDKDAKKLPDAIRKVVEHRQAGKVNWRQLYADN